MKNSRFVITLSFGLISLPASSAVILVPGLSDGNLALSGAGGAAIADNATTAYTNPAGMAVLGKDAISGSIGVMAYDNDYYSGSGAGDAPNSGSVMPYGNVFIVKQLHEKIAVGLSLTAPGGASLDYGTDWEGKAQLNDVSLTSIQINPSFSYQISPKLSAGLGIAIEYMTVEENVFNKRINIKADDWNAGFNFGFLYSLTEDDRVGLAYRSEIKHDLSGDYSLNGGQSGTVDLNMPNAAQLDVSGFHKLTNSFDFVWNVGMEFWGDYDITYVSVESGIPKGVYNRDFDNVYTVSLGGRYHFNDKYRLDFGSSYATNPQSDDTKIYPDLPVNDIFNVGIGLNYQIMPTLAINFAYQYNDYGTRNIDQSRSVVGVQGKYEQNNQLFAVQLDYDY
ncbi:OmpP1/FadL family transporter [Vibrio sp. E150_011]